MDGTVSQLDRGVRLWLRLVGDFDASFGTGDSALPISKKARALLALIAAHSPQPIRRDYAAGLLWSAKPREYAANSLRQALRELQIAVGACGSPSVIVTGGGRLSLDTRAVWVDVHDTQPGEWGAGHEAGIGHLLLCQNLAGLDPALDRHFDQLWKNLVFQKAFVPPAMEYAALPPKPPLAPESGRQSALIPDPGTLLSRSPAAPGVTGPSPAPASPGPPDKGWRIAVLPFRTLGGAQPEGLSLGLAEEISAALAKFRMPRLIATGSFWDQSGPAADALARCRSYNLDYVISGTIQVAGQRIRVTVNLLDVSMEFEVIWAARFDGQLDDVFTLQDTIASQTVAQIDPELLQRHRFRGETANAPNAEAHQALLTAIQGIYRADRGRFLQARFELEKAIRLDPAYAAPHAWLAYWYVCVMAEGWSEDPVKAAARAGVAAECAVGLDPLDARGLSIAGHVKAYLQHDIHAALVLHDRAISLNPNLPIVWTLSSWSRIYNGEHQLALNQTLKAEALSPTDPHMFAVEHAAMTARFFLGDLEAAERLALRSLDRRPRHLTALKVRLAALGHLGRLADAAGCITAMRSAGLDITVDALIARPPLRPRDRHFYLTGLRLAGVAG